MRKFISMMLFAFIAISAMMVSCEKEELLEPQLTSNTEKNAYSKGTSSVTGLERGELDLVDGSLPDFEISDRFIGLDPVYSTVNYLGTSTGSVFMNSLYRYTTHILLEDTPQTDDIFSFWVNTEGYRNFTTLYICIADASTGHPADNSEWYTPEPVADTWTQIIWDDFASMYNQYANDHPSTTEFMVTISSVGKTYYDGFIYGAETLLQTPVPTISGNSSVTISSADWAAMGYGYVEGFAATYGHDEYLWMVPPGCVILGANDNQTVTIQFNGTGTYTFYCKAKDDGKSWSEVDSHAFTVTVN